MAERKTLMERLKSGEMPDAVKRAAESEPVDAAVLADEIVNGTAVVTLNSLLEL